MSRRELWQQVYLRFNPDEAVPVDRPGWRAERTRTPLGEILQLLDTPFADSRVLLLGTVGTGKTTELLRLSEARKDKDFVLFVDLVGHFNKVVGNPEALQHISTWEVCFLVGLALYRAAEEKLAFPWQPDVLAGLEKAWSAAAKAAGAPDARQLDLGKLAKGMLSLGAALVPALLDGGATAGLLVGGALAGGTAAESLRWNLPLGQTKKKLPDDDDQVRTLLAAVNRVIQEILVAHGRVLLVIDGLDRIQDEARARTLFVESDLLARLACPVVVCGPFALRHHLDLSEVRRFQCFPLVNEPVLQQHAPDRPGPGLDFFLDLFHRRLADLQAADLVSDELLRYLAYCSGGRARDFVRMVHSLALKCYHADVDAAGATHVEAAIDEARRLLETGMHRGHIDLLRAVMEDPDHRLPQDELVWDLLRSSRLLPYPNRSEWFYPHPLLTMHLLGGLTK